MVHEGRVGRKVREAKFKVQAKFKGQESRAGEGGNDYEDEGEEGETLNC
jgi:hypothetical protein